MRKLGELLTRAIYSGTFVKTGGYRNDKVLIKNLFDSKHRLICDHVWVKNNGWNTGMTPGSIFTFSAVPIKYVKGNYRTTQVFEVDMTLADIKDIRVTGWDRIRRRKIDK
jgi:hypothetical protein